MFKNRVLLGGLHYGCISVAQYCTWIQGVSRGGGGDPQQVGASWELTSLEGPGTCHWRFLRTPGSLTLLSLASDPLPRNLYPMILRHLSSRQNGDSWLAWPKYLQPPRAPGNIPPRAGQCFQKMMAWKKVNTRFFDWTFLQSLYSDNRDL